MNGRATLRYDFMSETLVVQPYVPDFSDPICANEPRTWTHEGSKNFRARNLIVDGPGVRRLTPRECERLQGFPDDFTLVRYRGAPMRDATRYRLIGNSMAVPVVRWIGERIQLVERQARDRDHD